MENELNYLSEKIEKVEASIEHCIEYKFPKWKNTLPKLESELELLQNILNVLTINELND